MLILLSPTRTMDMSTPVPTDCPPATIPHFLNEAKQIADGMKELSAEELAKEMKLNPSLAMNSYIAYQHFGTLKNPSKPAILAYAGSVYKELNAYNFDKTDFEYAQKNVRILSTLYGWIKPLDKIEMYRMMLRIHVPGTDKGNLYNFWRPKLTPICIDDTHKHNGILINLASAEIFKALDSISLNKNIQVINPIFKDYRNGKLQSFQIYSKQARGKMAQYIIKNKLYNPEDLKHFTEDKYHYNDRLSSETQYIFIR